MANISPYATNSFGQTVNPIDFTKPGTPTLMLYHGGSIVVGNNIIGRITNWQAAGAYTREGVHIYELNNNTWGLPVDYVPGRATGFNVTFTRNEVWTQELEIALGYGAIWDNLTDQNYPFGAQEFLYKGTVPYRTWSYSGCWFTEKNPNEMTSDGDGVIKVACGMAFVSRKRTL